MPTFAEHSFAHKQKGHEGYQDYGDDGSYAMVACRGSLNSQGLLGETHYDSEKVAYTISYGSDENSTGLFLMLMERMFLDYAGEGLGFAGLLGVGPKNLPSKVSEAWEEDGGEEEEAYSRSYTLNDDGTIAKEEFNDNTYTYAYTDAATRAIGERAMPISTEQLLEIMKSKRVARNARHNHGK